MKRWICGDIDRHVYWRNPVATGAIFTQVCSLTGPAGCEVCHEQKQHGKQKSLRAAFY